MTTTDEFVLKNPTAEEKYGVGTRQLVGLLGFFAVGLCYCQRFSLSIAITVMATSHHLTKEDPDACPKPESANQTAGGYVEGEFDWDEQTQGMILSGFFWGYIILQVPGGWVSERLGAKHVLGTSILVSTAGTLLSPLVARTFGWIPFLALRFIIGLSQGPVYPALSVVMSVWTPAFERGTMGAIIFAGAQIGAVFAMAITGVVMNTFGWAGGFYLWGILGIFWLIVWYTYYTDSPHDHRWISARERDYILAFSGRSSNKELPPTPWLEMFTSIPLWALIVTQIGHDWGIFTIITDLPKYMSSVLHFSLKTNGLISGMPYLVMWIFAILSGMVSDWLVGPKKMDMTTVRKIFITIAQVGPGLGIIAASYAGCNQILASFYFIFGMGAMGTFIPSLKVNPIDLSPNYCGTTMALTNGIGAMSGLFTAYVVGVLTPNSFLKEWRNAFWICFSLLVGTNIVYLVWGTAAVQPWNNPKQKSKNEISSQH